LERPSTVDWGWNYFEIVAGTPFPGLYFEKRDYLENRTFDRDDSFTNRCGGKKNWVRGSQKGAFHRKEMAEKRREKRQNLN
jgi:hypothetical protein